MTDLIEDNPATYQGQYQQGSGAIRRSDKDVCLVAVSKNSLTKGSMPPLPPGSGFWRKPCAGSHGPLAAPPGGLPDLELRLIGPLQTNKAADAVGFFDVIESVDREKLARILASEMQKQSRHLPCLVQVNTGEEEQAGIAPQDAVAFTDFCRHDLGLEITGLMCIPPMDEEAAMHFALLRTLADKAGLPHLSMGMSSDYAEAITLAPPMCGLARLYLVRGQLPEIATASGR